MNINKEFKSKNGVVVITCKSKLFIVSRNISIFYRVLYDLFKCIVNYFNNKE